MTKSPASYILLIMYLSSIFCLLPLISVSAHAQDDCDDWFKASEVQPNTKNCMIKCNLIDTDMNTFICPNRCDEFCKPPPKCSPDPFWVKQIKVGRYADWPNESEKTVAWSKEEKEKLLTALDQLPDILKIKTLKGFYRLQSSIEIGNPATNSDGAIGLYDRAFNGPFGLARTLAHELAHQWYNSASSADQSKYRNTTGWTLNKDGEGVLADKSRKFVNSDGKGSLQEDFAHNLDTYLFDPDKLSSTTPQALTWFKNRFSDQLKLKTECKDGK